MSSLFHYNKDYIMRIFKKEIQMTIIEYMNHKRIFNSLDGLKSKNSSVLSVAFQYGFFSQEYYCEMFHQVIGVSPSEYRSFLNHSIGLKQETIFIIQDKISYLDSFFRKVDEYSKNVPTLQTVKVLSIFKK